MSAMKLIKNIKSSESEIKFPKEVIPYLLKAVESADQSTKNDIENQLVKMDEKAASLLSKELANFKGKTRGLIAMVLVRIGFKSISYLEAESTTETKWIVDYIINEIKGSNVSLSDKSCIANILVG